MRSIKFHNSLRVGIIRSLNKLMLIVIGARDFSPEITVHLIGTSVFALQAAPRQESPVLRQSSSPDKVVIILAIVWYLFDLIVRTVQLLR